MYHCGGAAAQSQDTGQVLAIRCLAQEQQWSSPSRFTVAVQQYFMYHMATVSDTRRKGLWVERVG